MRKFLRRGFSACVLVVTDYEGVGVRLGWMVGVSGFEAWEGLCLTHVLFVFFWRWQGERCGLAEQSCGMSQMRWRKLDGRLIFNTHRYRS